jgi:cell division protein ZipA
MPELRWTLLILGALFIAGLAFWEYRRQRHARGQTVDPRFGEGGDEATRSSHESYGGGSRGDPRDGPRVYREPTLTLPDVHLDERGGFHSAGPAEPRRQDPRVDARQEMRDRDPMADLPIVEIDDKELTGFRVDAGTAVDSFSMSAHHDAVDSDEHGDEVLRDAPDDLGQDDEKPATAAPLVPRLEPAEPMIAERRFVPRAASAESEAPTPSSGVEAAARAHAADFDEGVIGSARVVGESLPSEFSEEDDATSGEPEAPAAPLNIDADAFAVSEPIVEWPEDDTRKIIALRLVSGGGDRFAGRAVRLALAAEGFLLGKFDIFHKPGPDARAILSAASLTKPGTFAMSTMDSQRFGGLSLFAVLPGPLSPTATFDELLTTARSLNDRLRGALQDERGEPLTPVRSASIRDSLTAQATAAAPVVGPPPVGAPAPENNATPH